MEAKNHPSKKVFDITSPKRPSATTRPLLVANRPVMKQDPMVSNTLPEKDEDKITVSTTAPTLMPTNHLTIARPKEDTIVPEEGTTVEESTEVQDEKPAEEVEKASESKKEIVPTAPTKEIDEVSPLDDAELEEKPSNDETPLKPELEDQLAKEADTVRQKELEGIIESRQYFVPINAVERKRSLKITIGLMLLVVLLGILLVDMMLDAGFIHTTQKIPHTHFFEVHK